MNTLSDRIKTVMDEQNIQTAAQLAKIARVTNQAVSQWINNSTKTMDAKAAFRMQKLFGYSAEWLYDGTGPRRLDEAAREQQAIYRLDGNFLDLRLLNPLAAEILKSAYQTAVRLDGAAL